MFPRRIMLVVIAVMGVMALAATLATRNGARDTGDRPAPTARQTDLRAPDAVDVDATLSTAGTDKPKTVEAELGDQVRIVVESGTLNSVSLGDLSTQAVEPDVPATFELLADTPGRYPLVELDGERTIGTLEVR